LISAIVADWLGSLVSKVIVPPSVVKLPTTVSLVSAVTTLVASTKGCFATKLAPNAPNKTRAESDIIIFFFHHIEPPLVYHTPKIA